jgi:ABC-type polysaccharide/polyol phosphate export permease
MKFLLVLIERRPLIYHMARRDFEQRFVGSAAGWLWTIIHPLVMLLCWVFVFQKCLKTPPPPGAGDNYTLYLFCGYLPWMLFSDTIQRASGALLDQSNLITKTVFPSEIIPVTVFLSSLANHVLAVVLAVGMVRYMTGHFSVLILLLPIYTLLLGMFALGIGWIAASLQVFLRDTAQVVLVLMTGWFWLTPIFVDETMFPQGAQFLVRWNPLAHVVKGYRQRLMTGELPAWNDLALLAVISLTVFAIGGMFFRHLKRGFADVL